MMSRTKVGREFARRGRQAARIVGDGGPRGLAERALAKAVKSLPATPEIPEVRREDVLGADLTNPPAVALADRADDRLTMNWVMSPPGPGSGGHTTIFRLMAYLEGQGHRNRIYLYDVHGGDAEYYEAEIRDYYPNVAAPVHDVADGFEPAEFQIATSWASAYPVYRSSAPGIRGYLVQDFEPWFYAHSASAALAENTYRMGFHAITAGRWLAEKLRDDYGMSTDHFDFGCDTSRYRLENVGSRNGVVFYARRTAGRRAFELGVLALELFSERNPDVELHFYGEKIGKLPFEFIDHGLVTPDELNSIYNRCFAGLSLSMTNVSLVPHEMLASGCIPVVNDEDHNRIVLDNEYVRYAPASPHELVCALEAAEQTYSDPVDPELVRVVSDSVKDASWEVAGRQVEEALERAVASR